MNSIDNNVRNPQFNVALLGKHVFVACDKKMLNEIREILLSNEETARDFEEFIDQTCKINADGGNYASSDEYCISGFNEVYQIIMTQEFAKDLSFCMIDGVRSMPRGYVGANALMAFGRKLGLAGDGEFNRLQGTPKMMAPQPPMMMYQAVPVFRNQQPNFRRRYGN